MRVSSRSLLATWLIVVTCLGGCASRPTIRSHSDAAADFSRYKTFAFFSRTSGNAGYQSFADTYITSAIVREMQARGFQPAADSPDLMVNFHVQTQDKVEVTDSPSGYYGYRGGLYGWGGGYTSVDTYTQGTMNIDIVDLTASKLLWEGIAIGRITDKARDNLQPAVDEVVKEIFEQFPKQP
jgi:hypothetical protein